MAWFQRPQPDLETEGDVLGRRIAAVLIDIILVAIVTSILAGLLLAGRAAQLGSIFALLISFGYYIYFEGTYGQTIGKMALDIVVVTEEGGHIEYQAAAIRTVLRIIDVLPVFYIVGLVVILVTDRDQRVGDLVANTVVVRAQ